MRATGFVPSGRNVMLVRVTTYEDKCLRGIISGPGQERLCRFNSTVQMLLMMEEMMDRSGGPQRGTEFRAFPAARELSSGPPEEGEGKSSLASFQVSVLFRQNASWQGSLLWVDHQLDAQFRSVWELLLLLDSAMAGEPAGSGVSM